MYLALDLYAITARYVGSPEDLNNVLAAFESSTPATTETHLQDPDTSGEMRDDPMVGFALFINGLVHELSSGRLARPIGGFILFLFLTILIRIVLSVLGYGVKLIIAVLPGKPDDDEPKLPDQH